MTTIEPCDDLQSALAAALARDGDIRLAPGDYRAKSTLVLGNGIRSLRGAGIEGTRIVYAGDPARPVIQVDRGVWYANFGGFTLRGPGRSVGVGIRACRDERPASYAGTVCGSNRYSDMIVVGFGRGVLLGDGGHSATSENRFSRLSIIDCDEGVYLTDYNTLNNHFTELNLSQVDRGVWCEWGGGHTHIDGGSASEIGRPETDHYRKGVFGFNSGGVYSVKRYRQGEGGTGRFLGLSGADSDCTVSDCEVMGTHPYLGWVIDAYYQSSLMLSGCRLDGHVLVSRLQGAVSAYHCVTERERLFELREVDPAVGQVRQYGCARKGAGTRELLPDGSVPA